MVGRNICGPTLLGSGAAVHADLRGLVSLAERGTIGSQVQALQEQAGSASRELFGGGSASVGGALQEAGEKLEFLVVVLGADLVHCGVHP